MSKNCCREFFDDFDCCHKHPEHREGFRDIKEGVKDIREGLRDIEKSKVREGVRVIKEGLRDIEEGLYEHCFLKEPCHPVSMISVPISFLW